MRRAALTFLALTLVVLAVAPAHAKGGATFEVAVVQCKGDGAQLAVDAVSVSTAEPVIEVGDMCGEALKALQDAGFVTDSTISRPVTFTYTLTNPALDGKKAK